jgi:2-polyprenyl-6-methoxyphenol hydroxylase-like FAD-dependent oxidoreductase
MPNILVLGGGVCGLGSALMLARDGHDVTVLERDPASVPGSALEAWEHWDRAGVRQFRGPHYLLAAGRATLSQELPEIIDAMLDARGARFNPLSAMPPSIEDRAPRPGDERLETVTARRPVIDYAAATVAAAEPRLEVRRGVEVSELLTRLLHGVPHVEGVRTSSGEELRADLVVDAMGRRSELPALLRAAGADPMHEEAEDSGFIYYTRFFAGELPPVRAPLNMPLGTISVLTLPSDAGTWSVTVYVSAGDQPLKALRHEAAWTRVVAALPMHAHWLEGEPITGVEAMGGILDRFRRLVVGGQPVATGVAMVADACACTNPSFGKGITLGLLHARRLRDVVREHLGDGPAAFAQAWDADTEAQLVPWYRATVREDRARLREVEALSEGRSPPAPESREAELMAVLLLAARQDADVFRAMLELRACLALPEEIFGRPGMAERITQLTDGVPARPPPGPDRERLLALIA